MEDMLRTVLCQDYQSLEYILVDVGSTDDFLNLVKRLCNRSTYANIKIISGKNGGRQQLDNTG